MSRAVPERGTLLAWAALRTVAGLIAAIALAHWLDALVEGRPVLYGEGAVANAARLLREGNPYTDASGMVAANYPPLYLWLTSLGEPLKAGRAVTIASALAVGGVLWWKAGGLGRLPRSALVLTWLAIAPVSIWGAAVKPDMLAVALTVGGVALLERFTGASPGSRRATIGPVLGGALLALAVWAKPTALLPAIAVLAFLAIAARPALARAVAGAGVVATIAVAHAATLGLSDVWRHVVAWNALPWSAEQTLLLLVLAVTSLGILITVGGRLGAFRGISAAYLVGAIGVALLGGREGASINYLLDLAAATCFGLSGVSARLGSSPGFPVAATAQVLLGFVLLSPFGLVPGREPGTGAWGSAERSIAIASLDRDRPHLVEDSGLLIAAGIEPVVDDLFLWSRLSQSGLVDPGPLIQRVRSGEFATIVAELDLAAYDAAPGYERARWRRELVEAVLERYALDPARAQSDRTGSKGLWIYRPR